MNKEAAKSTQRDVKQQQADYYQDPTIAGLIDHLADISSHATPIAVFSEEGFAQIDFSDPSLKAEYDRTIAELTEYKRSKYPLLFATP